MSDRQLATAIFWVAVAVAVTMTAVLLFLASGESPSYCGDCPEYWQQQPWDGEVP